jgi:predicted AAA+ superfamily ATPase
MKPRLLDKPGQSFFLLGPLGSGKTTWLKSVFPDAPWIDLLSEETYQRLLAHPGHFADELRPLRKASWVVVDEIQRLPNLLKEVHRFIETKRLKFVHFGSSARKLKQAGVNMLAGRAMRRFMHPFVPQELGKDFNEEKGALFEGLVAQLLRASKDYRALYDTIFFTGRRRVKPKPKSIFCWFEAMSSWPSRPSPASTSLTAGARG